MSMTGVDEAEAGRMRAAVLGQGGAISVESWPVPEVGPDDVLIAVSHCGVCGTDLHDVVDGWGRPGNVNGHEYSGTVVRVGGEVRHWSIGDLVVGGPRPGCGTCPSCLAGRPAVCLQRNQPGTGRFQGAFAEFVRIPQDQVVAVPPGLHPRVAALAEPLAVALHAITVSRLSPGADVAVFGVGPIGALIIAALAARGTHTVTAVEPAGPRQELAAALGAARVVHPDALDVPSIAEPMRIVESAVDVAFECSGRRAAMEGALAQLRPTGALVIVGAGMDPPHFDSNRILLNELVVTGSFNYDAGGFPDALALLASGALPVETLIEPVDLPLEGLRDAITALAGGAIPGKVMIAPSAPAHPASRAVGEGGLP
jgi:threonine dehydrogenase-like Zn-dependent dehydrogenase